MGQTAATPSTFNPVPHLIGIGVLGAANPLIYFSADPIVTWLLPVGSLALLVGLIYGVYRLIAPARAMASGIKPFVILAWVLMALNIVNTWTEKSATVAAPSPHPQMAAPPTAAPAVNDHNGFDAANAVLVSPPPTKDFDPTNAVLVEIRP